MPKIADRVKDTTTTATSGTITLANSAPSSFQTFGSAFANGDVVFYCIAHQTLNEWEVGYGTYTSSGTTLSRDTILANSSGTTSAITFSAGTKEVFNVVPAGYLNGVFDFLTAQVFL